MLFALSLNAFSQQSNADSIKPLKVPLTGFWGLKFGMTKQQVITSLTGRVPSNNLIMKPNQDLLVFHNIKFGGSVFDDVVIKFYKGKMFLSFFIKNFTISTRGDLKLDCSSFCDSYTAKYGENSGSFEDSTSGLTYWTDTSNNTQVGVSFYDDYGKDDYKVVIMYQDLTIEKIIKDEENKEL